MKYKFTINKDYYSNSYKVVLLNCLNFKDSTVICIVPSESIANYIVDELSLYIAIASDRKEDKIDFNYIKQLVNSKVKVVIRDIERAIKWKK